MQYFLDVVRNKLQTINIYTRLDKKKIKSLIKQYVIRTCRCNFKSVWTITTASVYFQGNSLISFNYFLLVTVRQLLSLIQEIEVIQGVQALLKRTLQQTTEQIR